VVFNVSEDDLPSVQAQLKGGRTLTVDAFDRANAKQIDSGKLTSLDNQIDTTTGTVKFRATFPNKTFSLYPNQFVNARLLLKTLRKVVLAPTAAVQHNGTDAFVYVVQQNNTVSVQQITTLTSNETVTAVQGVNAGTTLATSGFDRLENGTLVTVRGPTPQGQTNAGAPTP
jgi:multidrug efflux system membrane fusion protein